MRLNLIYEEIDKLAPFALSGEFCAKYGGHDNSGVLVDCDGEIKKILFSLDCSRLAVKRAKETGANLIVTHHPVIFYPISSMKAGDPVFECVKAGISVISAHLNLDCAAGGIDDSLMFALGGEKAEKTKYPLSGGGYGKFFRIPPRSGEEFLSRAQGALGTTRTLFYGNGREIGSVASFCGAGMDEESLSFALQCGADVVVSSDGKHHLIAQAVEAGKSVLLLTHYAAENYGFRRFYQTIKNKVDLPCEFFADGRFL